MLPTGSPVRGRGDRSLVGTGLAGHDAGMPAPDVDPAEALEVADAATWRSWLLAHHATAPEVWLVLPHRASGRAGPTYEESVEQALCVGWIDGIRRRHDETASRMRFTPRRPRSGWSDSNRERVARLEAAGLMTPAGTAEVDRARADGRW